MLKLFKGPVGCLSIPFRCEVKEFKVRWCRIWQCRVIRNTKPARELNLTLNKYLRTPKLLIIDDKGKYVNEVKRKLLIN